ncbi:MAG: hypothetical protein NW218_20580 [Saprospiraceae bacterium]|nr:hypothetical protein [Saprospiraceae bacterium]
MFYTTICTLLYAAIYCYKKSRSDKWLQRNVAGMLLLAFGIANSTSAQNLRVAYLGETLTHYGVRGGMEYNLQGIAALCAYTLIFLLNF